MTYSIFLGFYNNSLDLSNLNLASICLIPKKDDPKLVTNYKPISLINCSIKLITKTLTERLSTIISSLIDDSNGPSTYSIY